MTLLISDTDLSVKKLCTCCQDGVQLCVCVCARAQARALFHVQIPDRRSALLECNRNTVARGGASGHTVNRRKTKLRENAVWYVYETPRPGP
jgi:hypothetical protein